MGNKKILVIHYDPYFSAPILNILGAHPHTFIQLVRGLSEGLSIIRGGGVDMVVVECPLGLSAKVLSEFLLQINVTKTLVLLVAKEREFLDDFSGENIVKFKQDELESKVIPFIVNATRDRFKL